MGAIAEPHLNGHTVDAVRASQEQRLVEAALSCVARWGVAKTTLDDVAREAGCSRATVYRTFPGGKDGLLAAVVRSEVSRFFAGLAEALDVDGDLEDVLVSGITYAARTLEGHDALGFLLAHEPEAVLRRTAFKQMDSLLAAVVAVAAPYLARHLGEQQSRPAAELAARLTLSYVSCPAPTMPMTDAEPVRRLVRTFVLPGLARGATHP